MELGRILIWFYALPMGDLALYLVLTTAAFLYLKARFGQRSWWKWGLGALWLASLCAIAYLTVANRESGEAAQPVLRLFQSYRDVKNGGNVEIYRSNFMNAVLFYPAGLLTFTLLPEGWPRWCRGALTLVLLCAASAGIEYAQYVFALGRVEIDDVFHNSLGALAGILGGCFRWPTKKSQ